MQVWLSATRKANTWEAVADVKESSLFRCWPPGRWGMQVAGSKAYFHTSVQAEVFIRRERRKEWRDQGMGLKSLYV